MNFIDNIIILTTDRRFLFCLFCREEARPADVHAIPDPRAREGVPLQPLPDATAANRDRARALSDRAPDKDLVPEQANEAEKGASRRQGDKRAGATRARGAGPHEEAASREAGQDAAGTAERPSAAARGGSAAAAATPRRSRPRQGPK